MFERTQYADPAHCRSTHHLKYCKHHECPDSYKCQESYCIALHMVCDGVNDCPDSEDELFCDNLNTRGLLHCRGDDIYVHPRHINIYSNYSTFSTALKTFLLSNDLNYRITYM